ncbi:ATP-grasp domain-containing protein [Methylobacterium radiodurans]|uniref:ATP-grasp domain-containing protein n=1 Tax=Methylobacterium radiodurans TaxID=2202828 RepID=UPI0013A52FF8|nr:ATP-grasp domain-containing protein [Methylobacterium radiodurans]
MNNTVHGVVARAGPLGPDIGSCKERLAGGGVRTARKALLLAEGFRLQYRVLRCATEAFDEIYVLGTGEAAQLRHSRACTRYIPAHEPLSALFEHRGEALNVLCAKHHIDCVLPSCSSTTRLLAAHGSHLQTPHFPVPAPDTFAALDDKWEFAQVCAALGLPAPPTRLFATANELRQAAEDRTVTFPLMIKPTAMWGSYGVQRLDTPEQIPDKLSFSPVLCQDYLPGDDLCVFYLCQAGQILETFRYRRTTVGVESVEEPEVDHHAAALIRHFGYDGVIGFDVRRTPDGRVAFIECNPRFWYRMDVAMVTGVNFVTLGCATSPVPRGLQGNFLIRSPSRLVLGLLKPWGLNRLEWSYLGYLSRDLGANLRIGLTSLISGQQARGQQF